MSPIARAGLAIALLGLVALGSTSKFGGGRGVPKALGYVPLGLAVIVILALALITLIASGYLFGLDLQEAHRKTKLTLLALAVTAIAFWAVLSLAPRYHWWARTGPNHQECFLMGNRAKSDALYRYYMSHHLYAAYTRFCSSGAPGREVPVHKVKMGWSNNAALVLTIAGGSLLTLLVAGIAMASLAKRRSVGHPDTEDSVVLRALDESLDDLRNERDVRRAIIACYARMEKALARSGAARKPHEAPFEFLSRVLERIARGPGRVLTELFERAKFSIEPLGVTEKEQAITALEALRTASVTHR